MDAAGAAHMVDVEAKSETHRLAVASVRVVMSASTVAQLTSLRKGDALAVARLGGLAALKRTADLIPLCHPVRVVGADVDVTPDAEAGEVRIVCSVRAVDRTGVEMEAMVGASAAALALYDMIKGVERGARIERLQMELKSGGRSGLWRRTEEESSDLAPASSKRPARAQGKGSRRFAARTRRGM